MQAKKPKYFISVLILASLTAGLFAFQNCSNKQNSEQQVSSTSSPAPAPGLPPAVSATCSLSVEPLTHYGEFFTYKVTAPPGVTLPNPAILKFYGTKSKLDGTGTVTDANGAPVDTVSANPNSLTIKNSGNAVAGVYARHFAILNPATNREICSTNTVTHTLTPMCELDLPPKLINTNQSFVFQINTNTNPALGGTPSKILWFGTKDGVDDQGVAGTDYGIPLTSYPFTDNGPFPTSAIGVYVRYFKALDSTGHVLCKSASADLTITAP